MRDVSILKATTTASCVTARRRLKLGTALVLSAFVLLPLAAAHAEMPAPLLKAASENALRGADADLLTGAVLPQENTAKPAEAPTRTEDKAVALQKALEQAIATNAVRHLDPKLADLYAARNFQPLWIENGRLNVKAQAVIARIKRAEEDGLDITAFLVPELDLPATPDALAQADLELSQAVATYALHAQAGRVEPSSISALITAHPEKPSAPVAVMRVASARDSAEILESYNPPHAEFQALRKALAEARSKSEQKKSKPVIASGPVLRLGQSDARVAVLRDYFELTSQGNDIYDAELAEAVKSFQRASNIKATGIVGRQTVNVLNTPRKENPISQILVNMERWRWVPRDFGHFYVFVNVPDYMGRVYRDGNMVHEMRVIVGSVKNQTPLFSHKMEYIVVNPYWHVPRSIALKEMLPKLRSDPTYLARQGIEVVQVGKGRARVLDSTMIDWSGSINGLHFRQPPGERNALGRIKFMFPNEHSVYLHDTPGRHLFAQGNRALSHGCVRVQDPFALAEALQGEGAGNRLKKMIGGSERRINLTDQPNVHLVYFTMWMEGDQAVSRPDIYGHDRKLKAALNLGS